MSKKNGETQINKPLEKECGLYDAAAIFIEENLPGFFIAK